MARRRRKTKSATTYKPRSRRYKFSLAWIKTPDWHIVKRSAVGVAWLACLGGLFAAWTLGVPRLHAMASQRQSVSSHEVTVQFIDAPQWVNGPLGDSLLRTATMHVGGDPLVRNDLVAIRASLLTTGWFDDITQVRRVDPDLVQIRAKFVRPYTLVRDAGGYHLIDISGKLLPKSYAMGEELPAMFDPTLGETVPMIAISGVHFARPAVGETWDGADVTAGLRLLHLLNRQTWRHQITEIDVSLVLRDGPMQLRTDIGSTIIWGAAPGDEAALELMADGKLQRLNLLYTNHGRVDAHRVGELDITGEKVAVVR